MTPAGARLAAERRALIAQLRGLVALAARLRRQAVVFGALALAGNAAVVAWLAATPAADRAAGAPAALMVVVLTGLCGHLGRRAARDMRRARDRADQLAAILRLTKTTRSGR